MEMTSAVDVAGWAHELRQKKSFNIHVSHHSQPFSSPKSMGVFFNSPENMSIFHEISGHRDVLKIYYEKGSVLWKNCAQGREKTKIPDTDGVPFQK